MIVIYVFVILSVFLVLLGSNSAYRKLADFLSISMGVIALITLFNVTENLNFAYSDLQTYYRYFSLMHYWSVSDFLINHPFEFIYDASVYLLASIDKVLSLGTTAHDFVMLFEIVAIIFVFVAARQLFSVNQSVMVSLLYMVYQYQEVFAYNLVRQSLALSLGMLVITKLSKKKYIQSLLVAMLATQIHSSMKLIIVLPLFFMLFEIFKNNSKWISSMWVGVYIVAFISSVTRLNELLNHLPISFVQTYSSGEITSMASFSGDLTNSSKYLIMTLLLTFAAYILKTCVKGTFEGYVLNRFMFLISIAYMLMSFIPFTYRVLFSGLYFLLLFIVYVILKKEKYYLLIPLAIVVIVAGLSASPFTVLSV
ncbi:EpsG family protein [Weissella hellenica]|uniref:EpsG family protein n=1 Tax=Weissella hellenica TaxID=46256 RepID=UPI003889C446